MAEGVDHSHGDAGAKPSQSLNFQDGDYPDPETFDWFWSQVPSAINDHKDLLESIDSDEDGVVDAADGASSWSEAGNQILDHPTDINFTAGTGVSISVTDDTDGTITIDATLNVVASGELQLTSKTGVVALGLDDANATFFLALGVDDPNEDTKAVGRLFWDESAGTDGEYKIELVEVGTDVGNPIINYDVIRVR